jgi:Protein of unknown function (DUF4031)
LRRAVFSSEIDQTELHDPVGDHYDLTAGKRRQAVAAGAIEVNQYQAVVIWEAKREAVRLDRMQETE